MITIDKKIDDIQLDSKQLFPLGIIINEILTNTFKYAFTGRDSGSIEISLKKNKVNVTLSVRDNGIGLPDGFATEKQKGFGIMLIKMLTEQLEGSYTISDNHSGTESIFKFPI